MSDRNIGQIEFWVNLVFSSNLKSQKDNKNLWKNKSTNLINVERSGDSSMEEFVEETK